MTDFMQNTYPLNQTEHTVRPCVVVVDDDALVARAIMAVLAPLDFEVVCFHSAAEFAARREQFDEKPGCTLVDLQLANEYGLQLIHSLADEGRTRHRPNIVISGYADVTNTLQAMTLGCWTVLEKPFAFDRLRDTVREACEWSIMNQMRCRRERRARELWSLINEKERLTIEMILDGLPNKTVASRLGVSVRTVENRRRQIFNKLGIASVAQLGRIVAVVDSDETHRRRSQYNRITEYRLDAPQESLGGRFCGPADSVFQVPDDLSTVDGGG